MEQGEQHRLGSLATKKILKRGRNHDRTIRSNDRNIKSI
jgi:hypothetical protein